MFSLGMYTLVLQLIMLTSKSTQSLTMLSNVMRQQRLHAKSIIAMSTVASPKSPSSSSMPNNMRAISSQIKDVRQSMMDSDPRAAMMIDDFRGKKINDDDKQGVGVNMRVVEMKAAENKYDVLPVVYEPAKLDRYFRKRRGAVFTRVWQIVSASSSFLAAVLSDIALGRTKDIEFQRIKKYNCFLRPLFYQIGTGAKYSSGYIIVKSFGGITTIM